ncbi:MAG: hypothetical protein L0G16_02750, partial [Weeksellaceae bacterium]|nr:hypothetical protein [Weeksellaceae bacterium]
FIINGAAIRAVPVVPSYKSHPRPAFYKTARSARALPIPAAVEATKHAARSIHKVCCVNKKRIFANYKNYK